jgi:O-antigen biosynthesis protein
MRRIGDEVFRVLSSLRAHVRHALGWRRRRKDAARHLSLLREVFARAQELAAADLARTPRRPAAAGQVTLSVIVPAYNTSQAYLDTFIGSFLSQDMPDAELVIVDDGSPDKAAVDRLRAVSAPGVTVVLNATNKGIALASQDGLKAARGAWVTFMDHDDALAPHALRLVAATLERHPACSFLYTDEVVTDGAMVPHDLFLKPAWDPVLLSGVNYVNHLSVYRRERLLEMGGFRAGFDGSQDYDLLLRYTAGLREEEVIHLPYPAYVWRRDGTSYSATHAGRSADNARRALSERHDGAAVGSALILKDLHRVAFPAPEAGWPKVSCIMPSFEAPALAAIALKGLLETTDYPAIEVIVPDNGSTSPETLEAYARLQARHANLTVAIQAEPFNFAASINRGVALATGDIYLLVNNDVEVIDPSWLKEMVSCLAYGDVGVVGAKLLYPNRLSQHLGVIVGFGGYAGHWFMEEPETFPGPMGRLAVRQSLTAVTGACLLITKSCWDRIGPMDSERFRIAYNDIDLCLRARQAGYRVVWTPFATLIHHESASRGSDETPANIERFDREKANLKAAYATGSFIDPAINPWHTTDRSYPSIRLLTELPAARTAALPKG